MTTNKTGIFGGTFNPVHKGHIAIAEAFIKKLSLDILYVIPNGISPMKNTDVVSGEDRFNMLEIAFSGNDKVIISDIELLREGKSYTRDTIAQLRTLHPNAQLYLLTGDDWLDSFHKWKDYQFILDNADLVVANRGGEDITDALLRFESLLGKRPICLENEIVDASSSQFRLTKNKDDLPYGVYEYINKRGLYGI